MRSRINDEARISLMLESISNIDTFMEGVEAYEAFEGNKILCHAVAYNLQCIGESVYKLSNDFLETHKGIDWAAIEGLRARDFRQSVRDLSLLETLLGAMVVAHNP